MEAIKGHFGVIIRAILRSFRGISAFDTFKIVIFSFFRGFFANHLVFVGVILRSRMFGLGHDDLPGST